MADRNDASEPLPPSGIASSAHGDECSSEPTLSPSIAAKAMGVSSSTFKRWIDQGLIPVTKTAGGHRRLRLADVLAFARRGDSPRLDLGLLRVEESLAEQDSSGSAKDLYRALRDAKGAEIRRIIHGAYHAGVSAALIADQLVAPAMHLLGRAWETKAIEVMHEHRATELCISSLYQLLQVVRRKERPNAPRAVGGTPIGSQHVIGSLLAELVLADLGWSVRNLGGDQSPETFVEQIESLAPKLVWLSVNHMGDDEGLLREFRGVATVAGAHGAACVVGGQGASVDVRRQLVGWTYLAGFVELPSHVRASFPV